MAAQEQIILGTILQGKINLSISLRHSNKARKQLEEYCSVVEKDLGSVLILQTGRQKNFALDYGKAINSRNIQIDVNNRNIYKHISL